MTPARASQMSPRLPTFKFSNMQFSRRNFLKTTSLATTSLWLPQFLQAYSTPGALEHKGKVLIVLQLGGGNDGLNTLIPTRNDIYYRERPKLGIERSEALTLTDEAGLHPSLTALKAMYDDGDLAVLNSVGYPNPDRSHFRSMDIWQTASASDQYWTDGWLGRYLDAQCNGACGIKAIELDDTLGLALKGKKGSGLAMQNPESFYRNTHSDYFSDYAASHSPAHHADEPVDYLYKTMANAIASAEYLFEKNKTKKSKGNYPDTALAKKFQTIASLMLAGAETTVYYVSLGSFDTHVNQLAQQKRLFTEMNGVLEAFRKEMQEQGRWNDVMMVTFSEFGRRVAQNASGGTDHGAANQMFFMGGALRHKGLLNAMPDLSDLADGDLKYKVDFRQVYATILERWLDTPHENSLGGKFPLLSMI